jgi:hypothetical protein
MTESQTFIKKSMKKEAEAWIAKAKKWDLMAKGVSPKLSIENQEKLKSYCKLRAELCIRTANIHLERGGATS